MLQEHRVLAIGEDQEVPVNVRVIAATHRDLGEMVQQRAGVTLPWSTGPVEGHINRLKLLKHQLFGWARLDLLTRRVLRAA